MSQEFVQIQVIDSHTGGEPTRTVISGGPVPPEKGALAARDFLSREADWMRSALINEPRGFEAMVGAFLCDPSDESCATGVVFFNNVSYLNGCLHGTIGVIETLRYLGKISPGDHRVETPSGIVTARLSDDGKVTVRNVASYRYQTEVTLPVLAYGNITGDIAWGGNWFFLIDGQGPEVRFANIADLTHFTSAVRKALGAKSITGEDGGEIDHIEVFGEPHQSLNADSQNFVLCPGEAYDRSPCGTGTSAKLACLAASGSLAEGETWRQASIIGTIFEGSYETIPNSDQIIPIVKGTAYITGEATLLLSSNDPFRHGIHF